MSHSVWDSVDELRDELQKDVDKLLGPDIIALRLELDFMRHEVLAWARCKRCRARYVRVESGAERPLLTVSARMWEDALPVEMPSSWVPLMAMAGMSTDRRGVEVIDSAQRQTAGRTKASSSLHRRAPCARHQGQPVRVYRSRRSATMRRAYLQSHSITPSQLLAEGIVEIGRVGSIAFVLTKRGLHLMHADSIPPNNREGRLNTRDSVVPDELVLSAVEITR